MTDGRTAQARLERLLHVLPAASRPEGARLAELAETLGVTEARILEDLAEVTARNYYHAGGWLDDVQVLLGPGVVKVTRADGFERPGRLSPEETLCLSLALRGSAAASHAPSPIARDRLLDRAEGYLANRAWQGEDAPTVTAPDRDPDPEGIREVLLTAARDRRPCALAYVKAGAEDATLRVVHPYVVAYGEGAWYVVGHCAVEEDVRVFRIDRIVAADLAEGSFDVPGDFDVANFIDGGRVFHAQADREVRVRYSAKVARWIRERAGWTADVIEDGEDGSLVVRHRVADPQWVVSHALQYGADAEILEPDEIRALAREIARGLLAD
ncbi:MAG: WYL domain-containing protein [Gemmatimonadota bacterium]